MEESYERIMSDPTNLLRPGAMWSPEERELAS